MPNNTPASKTGPLVFDAARAPAQRALQAETETPPRSPSQAATTRSTTAIRRRIAADAVGEQLRSRQVPRSTQRSATTETTPSNDRRQPHRERVHAEDRCRDRFEDAVQRQILDPQIEERHERPLGRARRWRRRRARPVRRHALRRVGSEGECTHASASATMRAKRSVRSGQARTRHRETITLRGSPSLDSASCRRRRQPSAAAMFACGTSPLVTDLNLSVGTDQHERREAALQVRFCDAQIAIERDRIAHA